MFFNKNLKPLLIVFLFLPSVFLSPYVHCNEQIGISLNLVHFDYEEFSDSNSSLNTENGFIPGINFSASTETSLVKHKIDTGFYSGEIPYEGQTQSGKSHSTNTEEDFFRVSYKAMWSPRNLQMAFYGQISWQNWDRNITPNNNVLGLFERYRWWEYEVGLSAPLLETNTSKWLWRIGISRTDNASIMINLAPNGFGKPKLDLGSKFGFSGAIEYSYQLSEQNGINIKLQHHYWEFGKSNSKMISSHTSTISIHEPRSISKHTEISLSYTFTFKG